jgi:hypothetical protein
VINLEIDFEGGRKYIFDQLKDVSTIEKTIAALKANGITANSVETGEEVVHQRKLEALS